MPKHIANLSVSTAFATILFLLFQAAASAQVLEEIVVTAQKREQNIQDVGIAITAFSGDQLKELNMFETVSLGRQVPGLMVTDLGSDVTTVFNIRGISQNDFADHQEPPVAVYVDGAYVSYLAGVGMNMYDIDRVEVLKGPQGTLFGRNATGGLVHLISKRPTREAEGYGELTFGEYDKVRFEGAISGPLSDTVSARLSFASNYNDGPWKDDNGPADKGDNENYNIRGQLLYEPKDNLEVLLNLRGSYQTVNSAPWHPRRGYFQADGLVADDDFNQFVSHCENFFGLVGLGAFIPAGAVDCFASLAPIFGLGSAFEGDDDEFTIDHNQNSNYQRRYFGATATIEWDVGNYTLTSITNYQRFNKSYPREDSDATPYHLLELFQDQDSWDFSQELRIAGETDNTRWLAGIYYLKIDNELDTGTDFYRDLSFIAFDGLVDNQYTLETESWAVFAQAEYDVNENWTVLAGIRYTEDDKKFEFFPSCSGPLCGLLVFPGTIQADGFNSSVPGAQTKRDSNDWSAKLELDWRPNDDWLVYASVTRGHKAGGYNGGAFALWTQNEEIFDDEILTSYEGGFKATLFNGTTRFNTSVFYYDYNDIQVFSYQGTSLFVFNSDGDVTGAEIEIITNPAEGWEFLFGVSLLDTEVKDIEQGFLGLKDTDMVNSPEVTFNGLGRYEWPIANGKAALQLDFNWVDDRKLNIVDHPATKADDYFLLNAKASYTTGDNHWQFTAFVNNLTDEEYLVTAFQIPDLTGSIIDIYGLPRWVGGTITYRW